MVLGGLFGAVIIAALYFPILKRRVKQTAKIAPQSRRAGSPGIDATAGRQSDRAASESETFLGFGAHDGRSDPGDRRSAVSSDPVLRAKQV